MEHYPRRHNLRLDDVTQAALEEICRHTFSTKATIMRSYVMEGVARDSQKFAQEAEKVIKATDWLKAVKY